MYMSICWSEDKLFSFLAIEICVAQIIDYQGIKYTLAEWLLPIHGKDLNLTKGR